MRALIGRAIAGGEPTAVFKPPDMPQLRLWRVTDPGTINVIQSVLRDSEIFIADGHHRYEAALRYRSAVRAEREVGYDESVNFRMMLLVSFDEPGLITRGYHRLVESATDNEFADLVKSVEEICHIDEWDPPRDLSTTEQIEQFAIELGERKDDEVVFGLYGKEPGKFHIATMKSPPQAGNALEYCEYSYLHSHVIRAAVDVKREEQIISPHHDAGLIARQIDNGEARMAFIMRPVPLNEFVSIVTRGWRLPAKTTNFFPKPPAGAVIQQFGETL